MNEVMRFRVARAPQRAVLEDDRISNRSRRAVCRYFGWSVEAVMPSIVDDEDDLATEEASRAATAC